MKKNTQKLETLDTYTFGEKKAVVLPGKKANLFQKLDIVNSITILFILFISVNIINSVAIELKLDRQTRVLQQEFNIINTEHQTLKKQIAFYKSPGGIEKLARQNLGYIKSNEIPIRYIDNK